MLKETLIYILSFLKQLQAGCELSFRGTNAGSLFFPISNSKSSRLTTIFNNAV